MHFVHTCNCLCELEPLAEPSTLVVAACAIARYTLFSVPKLKHKSNDDSNESLLNQSLRIAFPPRGHHHIACAAACACCIASRCSRVAVCVPVTHDLAPTAEEDATSLLRRTNR